MLWGALGRQLRFSGASARLSRYGDSLLRPTLVCWQAWAATPRRAREALKKADPQLVDALEHRMLTALAEAAVAEARRDPDVDEVVPRNPSFRVPPTSCEQGTCQGTAALTSCTLPYARLGLSARCLQIANRVFLVPESCSMWVSGGAAARRLPAAARARHSAVPRVPVGQPARLSRRDGVPPRRA